MRTTPQERSAELRFSKASAKLGSYAADTSAERHLEFALTAAAVTFCDAAIASMRSSMRSDCIPVLPSLPVSSLSARTHIRVCGESRLSKRAVSAG